LRRRNLEQLRSIAAELEIANAKIEEERAHLAEKVTERTTQLEFANHAKDAFLATMSHEIRTPLGGMLGMMELLELSKLSPEQHDRLAVAQNSGKNLLRIVNDILDWSKIEAGKLELAPRTTSVNAMLNDVANTYKMLAAEKHIELLVKIDPKISANHNFDALRLSQILNNFTSNAIKFTSQGNIKIGAKLISRTTDNEKIIFSVKDDGVGISPEQQSRLFQHYEQATADLPACMAGRGWDWQSVCV
jgi:signal transduction histidine kinase